MERPTCKTCPYWNEIEYLHRSGYCKRFPATAYVKNEDDYKIADDLVRCDDDWCGEHPDFPAYIASLKRSP